MFGSDSIPASTISTSGRASRMRSTIAWMLRSVDAGSMPRSMSFAPVSSTTMSKSCRSSQSIRRSAPADVSPLTPAFTTSNGRPVSAMRRSIRSGNDCDSGSPRPAVRLVPMKSTVPRACTPRSPASMPFAPARPVAVASAAPPTAAASSAPAGSAAPRTGVLLSVPPHPIINAAIINATIGSAAKRRGANDFMLIARGLEKTYRSGDRTLTVLRNVALDIEEGGFVAILAPSGSGKTPLLGLLAGLDTPSSGNVRIAGTDITPLSEDERARFRRATVGFVFQSFQLIPSLTARENVQVPLELRGDRDVGKRAAELLRRVGLGNRLDHYPTQLSGGEQQRVALA